MYNARHGNLQTDKSELSLRQSYLMALNQSMLEASIGSLPCRGRPFHQPLANCSSGIAKPWLASTKGCLSGSGRESC